jgi:CNT family concentrative nucleoside transporter
MLALNVGGMLIAFISLVALVNGILGWAIPGLSMQSILGHIFAPIAWLLGVAWDDCATVGNLMGTRMVLNEFVAYSELGKIESMIDPHSKLIATYALCGFANLGSIAIAVGGVGALAPSRKSDIARLGFRAMLAGTLANFMTAAIAGVLL